MTESPHYKFCQSCGSKQEYARFSALQRAIKASALCNACRNRLRAHKGNYKQIPVSWFNEKVRHAANRNKEFSITIEYLWKIYIKQNRRCALSGVPLDFNASSEASTVSIDRVDNNKGYIVGNIQLLDSRVNMMKYTYSQKDFITICQQVADYTRSKKQPKQ